MRNLRFAQTCFEFFPQHLVLLLVDTLPKNVQVIVVQPVGLSQMVEVGDCCLTTSTLSNNKSSYISRKERTVFTTVVVAIGLPSILLVEIQVQQGRAVMDSVFLFDIIFI